MISADSISKNRFVFSFFMLQTLKLKQSFCKNQPEYLNNTYIPFRNIICPRSIVVVRGLGKAEVTGATPVEGFGVEMKSPKKQGFYFQTRLPSEIFSPFPIRIAKSLFKHAECFV